MVKLNGEVVPENIKNLILDIDNCVLDSREWEKYIPTDNTREGWDRYHDHYYLVCENSDMVDFVDILIKKGLQSIYFITAREDIHKMREITIGQLNAVFRNTKGWNKIKKYLYMRIFYILILFRMCLLI